MAEKLNATVVDMRFVKPIYEARILEMADNHDVIVTLEENAIQGGAGSAVSEVLNSHGKTTALYARKSVISDGGLRRTYSYHF